MNLRSSVAKRRFYVHVFAGILRSDLVAPELVFALEQAAGLARTPGAGLVGGNELAIARPLAQYRVDHPPRPFDLVETDEQAAVALDHVEQQGLVRLHGGRLAGAVRGVEPHDSRVHAESRLLGV